MNQEVNPAPGWAVALDCCDQGIEGGLRDKPARRLGTEVIAYPFSDELAFIGRFKPHPFVGLELRFRKARTRGGEALKPVWEPTSPPGRLEARMDVLSRKDPANPETPTPRLDESAGCFPAG